MRCATSECRLQMKAVFFILLLASHDATRVAQEVAWSKSKWDQLHANCSWSVKGCGHGCVRKPLPLDLNPGASCRHTDTYLLKHNGLQNFHTMIEMLVEKSEKYNKFCQKARLSSLNPKCKRREAQMIQVFRFITRVPTDESFVKTLGESERKSLHDNLEKVILNLADSQEEGKQMAELLKKIKGQRSEFFQDPIGTMVKMTTLGSDLLSGDADERNQAELQINAMEEGRSNVANGHEGLEKLKDLQKDFEEHRGEFSSMLDEVDRAVDEVVEEETDATDQSASSAVQVSESFPMARNEYLKALLFASVGTIGSSLVLLLSVSTPVGPALMFPAVFWVMFSAGCEMFEEGGYFSSTCFKEVALSPFKPVKALAKGAWHMGKGLYSRIRRSTDNTSALIEGPAPYEPHEFLLEAS